jgi:NADPH-dependent 2,4-dienoyl-CoA reductase/sulfur reductase-like enzyme
MSKRIVILRDAISRIETRGDWPIAFLESGREVKFDLAILATGVRPNVELVQKTGIELGATGAIAVDLYQRTSDPAIYAAGDNCESVHLSTGEGVIYGGFAFASEVDWQGSHG